MITTEELESALKHVRCNKASGMTNFKVSIGSMVGMPSTNGCYKSSMPLLSWSILHQCTKEMAKTLSKLTATEVYPSRTLQAP